MGRLLFTLTRKDFEMQTFCTGGKGGQNQNRRKMGVRFIHKPSGAVGEGREYREQARNKEAAFRRMAESPEFIKWNKIEASRILGNAIPETPEEIRERVNRMVDADLLNGNILIEEIEEDEPTE